MTKDGQSTGSRKWHIMTAILAITTLAPWAIYLAGLGRLTSKIDGTLNETLRMPVIMLEWYTVSAEFVYVLLIIIIAFAGGLKSTNSFLVGCLMCNTAIIIMRTTVRIQQINLLDDGIRTPQAVLEVSGYDGDPLPYLRAEAVGQIATCTWNFFLALFISLAAAEQLPSKEAAAASQPPVAA